MSVLADSDIAASERTAQTQMMARRAVAGATVGTALEWFDFALYGVVAATIFPKLFFPSLDPTASLLASLASFWAGLAARPLGAVICGVLGDRWGRRNLMLLTVSVMGASSFLMGLLPTYQQVGILAPTLLVSLRIVQGFALGGESTGAQLMAVEHASAERRGLYSGLLGICSPLSQILANLSLFTLSGLLSLEDFESFGWRIPFLASFVLVLLGIYIRMKVSETPAFEALRKSGQRPRAANPLGIVLKFHWRTALRLTLFFCGPAALFYLIVVFSLSYLTKNLGVPKQTGFMLLMAFLTVISFAAGVAFLIMGAWPIFGFLGLDVLAIYVAFKINFRHARAREEITVTPSELRVRRVSHRGHVMEWVLNPLWVQIDQITHEEFGIERLYLVSSGRRVSIGSFLGAEEKASFSKALRAGIAAAKRGVAYNPIT